MVQLHANASPPILPRCEAPGRIQRFLVSFCYPYTYFELRPLNKAAVRVLKQRTLPIDNGTLRTMSRMSPRFGTILSCIMLFGLSSRLLADGPVPPQSAEQPKPEPPAAPAENSREDCEERRVNAPNSWSDPRVIAVLAKQCYWSRREERWIFVDQEGATHPLVCTLGREQSCSPEPCSEDGRVEAGCWWDCEQTCKGCSNRCGVQCQSCKARCRDDACRVECAKKCATCNEGCVRSMDRCGSGKCANELKQCWKKVKEAWIKKGCDKACAVITACEERCGQGEPELKQSCKQRCEDAMKGSRCAHELFYCPQRESYMGGYSMQEDR